MPDLTGCPILPERRPTKALIGGTNKQNYDLLLSKYIQAGSRVCEQYALVTGCGCDVANEAGFVTEPIVPNRVSAASGNCPRKGNAKPSDLKCN